MNGLALNWALKNVEKWGMNTLQRGNTEKDTYDEQAKDKLSLLRLIVRSVGVWMEYRSSSWQALNVFL